MSENDRFRVLTPTLGMSVVEGERIPVTIPANATVIVTSKKDPEGLITILWDEKPLLMYAHDLDARTEIVLSVGSTTA